MTYKNFFQISDFISLCSFYIFHFYIDIRILSPDGKCLATGDANNEVRLWRLPNCELDSVFQAHTDWVFSIAFSPDGKKLASGSQDGTIIIQKLREEKSLKDRTIEHETWVRSIAFNFDGLLLGSVGGDYEVKSFGISILVTV
jgi:WD40 repeat protein